MTDNPAAPATTDGGAPPPDASEIERVVVLDTVVDYTSEPEQVWTLDESDYGDEGSTA